MSSFGVCVVGGGVCKGMGWSHLRAKEALECVWDGGA